MSRRVLLLTLSAALLLPGCARLRRRVHKGPEAMPASFEVRRSTVAAHFIAPPFTVNPEDPAAPFPSEFFVDSGRVLAGYRQALLKDPGLKTAYDGYFLKKDSTFEQLWKSTKRQADRATDWLMLYPPTALPLGTYRAVRGAIGQGERNYEREFSKEDEMAAEVRRDFRYALEKVARESRVQRVTDASAAGLLYVDPSWDLTDRVTETLIAAKKAELAAPAPEEPPPAPKP
ncbi:MAG: hypothetical protein WC969_01210 [Elusimicrobiota bacterium]|jgi:hypothetical protein